MGEEEKVFNFGGESKYQKEIMDLMEKINAEGIVLIVVTKDRGPGAGSAFKRSPEGLYFLGKLPGILVNMAYQHIDFIESSSGKVQQETAKA